MTMSKIRIESKSQPTHFLPTSPRSCLWLCQRYELKANHNTKYLLTFLRIVVYDYVKDTNWKQITTYTCNAYGYFRLFMTMSKIRIESKSQLGLKEMISSICCLWLCQRYELKANHNTPTYQLGAVTVVYDYVKDTNWKQITTRCNWINRFWLLFMTMSKIRNESKSQLSAIVFDSKCGCLWLCQRYELKANHNPIGNNAKRVIVVYDYVKDTNWKQITTFTIQLLNLVRLFMTMSKIRIESKSQHLVRWYCECTCCLWLCQRYELKANHNSVVFYEQSNTLFMTMFRRGSLKYTKHQS